MRLDVVKGQRLRLPAWAVTEGPFGVRLFDAGVVALVIAALEINVKTGGGAGSVPLNAWAYLFGALLAVPILLRHRWPLQVLVVSAVVTFCYYIFARRNISPAPLFFVPLYDAAVAGYLAIAIVIPAFFMIIGAFVVEMSTREGLASLTAEFLSQTAILALAVTLGEVVRGRQALTAETARRLRLADWERAAEAGRVVAEERLRIARELHDTVAHSMATITVQAASALHLLASSGSTIRPFPPNDPDSRPRVPVAPPRADAARPDAAGADPADADPAETDPAETDAAGTDAAGLRAALTAIRETSKGALIEMRSVLGQLRRSGHSAPDGTGKAVAPLASSGAAGVSGGMGLSRLDALRDAVTAAGASVTVHVEGTPSPLPAETDHCAYRILQESLTNVLRHAGSGSPAQVDLRYQPEALTITVTNDGPAPGGNAATTADSAPRESAAPATDQVTSRGDGISYGVADGHGDRGHGISGMCERAVSVGGKLTAGPTPGGGFQVQATLPTATPSDAGTASASARTSPASNAAGQEDAS